MYRKLQVFTKTTNFREATKVVEVELKAPNEEQIRVRNIYAGVNATDINITAAKYFTDGNIPFDIGLESIGIVDEVGSKVTKFKKDQAVLVMKNNPDGFSEYSYASEEELYPLPELKPDYLVMFINGLTASIGLDRAADINCGEKVLITAAAGGTGQMAVQWAKYRDCYVIAMTSSEEKAKRLKELGADFIINYKKDNVNEVLKKNFPNGVNIIWETIGGETFRTLFENLSIKGRLLIVGSITSYKDGTSFGNIGDIENLKEKLLMGSKSLVGFMLMNWRDYFDEYLEVLTDLINKKEFKGLVDLGEETSEGKFFGLDQVWRAEEHLHSGKSMGKVIVQIQEH